MFVQGHAQHSSIFYIIMLSLAFGHVFPLVPAFAVFAFLFVLHCVVVLVIASVLVFVLALLMLWFRLCFCQCCCSVRVRDVFVCASVCAYVFCNSARPSPALSICQSSCSSFWFILLC